MYLATTPEETALRIQSGLTDILSQTGAQGGIAVSTVNLPRGDSQGLLRHLQPCRLGRRPDRQRRSTRPPARSPSTPTWSAAGQAARARLDDARHRHLQRRRGHGLHRGQRRRHGEPGRRSTATMPRSSTTCAATAAAKAPTFRTRTSLMGAVINSEPVVAREEGVVYVASGEGMLHAFDTSAGNAGNELWAFVPQQGAGQHRRDGASAATPFAPSTTVRRCWASSAPQASCWSRAWAWPDAATSLWTSATRAA